MDDLLQDLRFAIRQMAAKPLLSVLAIVSLALGVGVNSSIFSLVNAVLFRGLPVRCRPRGRGVYQRIRRHAHAPSSFPDFRDLRDQNDVLAGLAAHSAFIAAFETTPARSRSSARW